MADPRTVTQTYRRQATVLRLSTVRDYQRLWPALRFDALDDTFGPLVQSSTLLVQRNRRTATGLASVYVPAVREAQGVTGAVKIIRADPVDPLRLTASLIATTLAPIKKATSLGVDPRVAMRNAFVVSSGVVSRFVDEAGRETVMQTTVNDPKAKGWQRVTSGGCDFCEMLAGRGSVYSEESASFEAHGHCACSAEPVY